MKFLCLPGAYGSAKNFEVQFGPLAEEFKRRGLGSFTYSQGTHEVAPPTGWEDYFGKPPLYRFLDVSNGDAFETLRRLRHVPRGLNPEDTMRQLQGATKEEDWHKEAWREALDGVFQTIDDDPEIDAILGYSEGAMVAASAIVEEQERCMREKGRERRIKFAIFIAGAPPLKFEGNKITAQLADEVGAVIGIPTLHIFGCDDAFLSSAVALFNVCDPVTSVMYDHGLGHIVPRDAENVSLLGTVLSNLAPIVQDQIKRDAHFIRKDRREIKREAKKKNKPKGPPPAAENSPAQGVGIVRPAMHQRGNSHLSVGSAQGGNTSSDPGTSGSITPAEVDFTVAMLRRTDV